MLSKLALSWIIPVAVSTALLTKDRSPRTGARDGPGRHRLDPEGADRPVALDALELLLRHREGDVDRVDAVDHDQRIADVVGLHDIALVDQEIAGAPVDGRADLRVRELQPRVLHRRLVRPHHGARGLHRGLVGLDRGGQAQLVRADLVVLLARDHAAVDEPPVAILLDHGIVVLRRVAREVGLGLADLRLMLGELGARLLERGLEGARVDGEEEVARLGRPAPP